MRLCYNQIGDNVTIEVKEREKSFFDECLYITNFFPRVLRKPNKKVMSATKEYMRTLIGYLIYAIIFIFIGINDDFDTLTVIYLVIFCLFTFIFQKSFNHFQKFL